MVVDIRLLRAYNINIIEKSNDFCTGRRYDGVLVFVFDKSIDVNRVKSVKSLCIV